MDECVERVNNFFISSNRNQEIKTELYLDKFSTYHGVHLVNAMMLKIRS